MSQGVARALWAAVAEAAAAHAVMLRDVATFDDAVAAAVLVAIDAAAHGSPPAETSSALVAAFDERVEATVAPNAAGAPSVARARAETAATATRIVLRQELLALLASLDRARLAFLDLADAHVFTLMPAFGEGHPLQPTSFAHWLGGVVAPAGRGAGRVRQAVADVNRSPMGAGALASTGLRIDREAVAAALGFDGPAPNTFDALAATDHLRDAVGVAAAAVAPVARWLDEMLVWVRSEPDSLRLDEAWLAEADPAVPQFRPARELERLAAAARAVDLDGWAVVALLARIPYGPAGAAIDEPVRRALAILGAARDILDRTAGFASSLQINRANLANRAGRDLTTASELADFIMLEEAIDPASARAIAAISVRRATEGGLEMAGLTPQIIDGAALLVIGRELGIAIERFGGYLAPRRVLERRGATGSPNPNATRDWLELERTRVLADERWREETEARLRAARERLRREIDGALAGE